MKDFFRIITCVIVFLCAALTADASCPRCHGSGRIKTFASASTYGVSSKQQQCPVCRQMVPFGETHYDDCPQCGGSGNSRKGSTSRSSANDKYQEQASELMAYLDPAEMVALENLLKTLYMGQMIMKECKACNGSGYCHVCGGYVNTNPDAIVCAACSGTGKCIACYGAGNLGTEYVDWTGSEREQLISRIKYYFDEALRRQREQQEMGSLAGDDYGNSAYDTIGYDNDGAYTQDTLPSNVDDDSNYYDGRSPEGRSQFTILKVLLGGFVIVLLSAIVGLLVFLLLKKKR